MRCLNLVNLLSLVASARGSPSGCNPDHRLAIMMLARPDGELPFKEDWKIWREGADNWAKANGCPEGAPLDMFIHVKGNFTETSPSMFHKVPAVECEWGDLLPCESNLMRGVWKAIQRRDKTDWYALISDDSVPVRAFGEMYRNLMNKNTTRAHFAAKEFGTPDNLKSPCGKHSQWMILRRDHMKLLVEGVQDWMSSDWLYRPADSDSYEGGLMAASDEWAPGCYLLNKIGGWDKLLPEINDGSTLGLKNYFMYVCWEGCHQSGMCSGIKMPCKYSKIFASSLMGEVRSSGAFFMRKVTPNSIVTFDATSTTPIRLADLLIFA